MGIQVEDINNKFENLVKIEENSWKPLEPTQAIRNVIKPRPLKKSFSDIPKMPKEASRGLKALIAARRKATKSVSSPVVPVQEPFPAVTVSSYDSSETESVLKETQDDDAKTFDGGFFTVKSPMCERKSPRSCKSSSNKNRQAAYSNSAKKINSLLLSPFISAMAKISLTSTSGSPLTSDTSNSNLSPLKIPKPTILFECAEDDNEVDDEAEGSGTKPDVDEEVSSGSPKLDECYFKPSISITPASCVDLINLESLQRRTVNVNRNM